MSGEVRRIDAGGLELHCELLGSGPPLLLLHGFTGSGRGLEPLALGLCDRFRTVRVDLVGHGASDAPREPAAYSMASCVAQLVAVQDALGLPCAHLLGYSMGGRVALSLATAHPARALSAVLVGASAGIGDDAARAARVRDDEALADSILRDGVPAFVARWMALPLFESQRRLGAEFLAQARAERLANAAHGLALSLRGMGSGAQPPLHARLAGLDLPCLLVAGELDPRFQGIARELATRLPRAETAVVPDAGHAAHLEQPQAFLRRVRGFLARCADAAPAPHPNPTPHATGGSPSP